METVAVRQPFFLYSSSLSQVDYTVQKAAASSELSSWIRLEGEKNTHTHKEQSSVAISRFPHAKAALFIIPRAGIIISGSVMIMQRQQQQ